MQITRETVVFAEEAKEAFKLNPEFRTYRNFDESLIALRIGMDNDCIQVFRLGEDLGLFAQWIDD